MVCRLWCLNYYRRQTALSRTSKLIEPISMFGPVLNSRPWESYRGVTIDPAGTAGGTGDPRPAWPSFLLLLECLLSHTQACLRGFLLPETHHPSFQGPHAAPLPPPPRAPHDRLSHTVSQPQTSLSEGGIYSLCLGQPASAGWPACLLARPLLGLALNLLHPQSLSVLGWAPCLQRVSVGGGSSSSPGSRGTGHLAGGGGSLRRGVFCWLNT